MYVCAICGREYKTIDERVECETKCLKARYEAEELKRKQILEEEKELRRLEIEDKYDELMTLIRDYMKNYGTLKLRSRDEDNFWPNWLGKWWF